MSDPLAAALAYAAAGLKVFPCWEIVGDDCTCPATHPSRDAHGRCGSPGKHPRTKNGVKDASDEPEQIRRWWERWPRANVAIATGASHLLGVDVDPRNGGDASLAELEAAHGRLPDTPRQLTGGGGLHVLLQRPDRPHVRGPRHGLGRGIDLKCDGGYLIAAPSNHLSGTPYAWELGHALEDVPIAPAPPWLLALLDNRAPTKGNGAAPTAVSQGLLGAAMAEAGWLGRPLGPDKAACRCPQEDQHTTGARLNGSTVCYAPHVPGGLGGFFCSHAHCRELGPEAVLATLPLDAVAAARAALTAAGYAQPSSNGSVPPPTDADAPPESGPSKLRKADTRSRASAGDLAALLTSDPRWAGCLAYDGFAHRLTWARPVPIVPGLARPLVGEVLRDEDVTYVAHWAALERGWSVGLDQAHAACALAGRSHVVHPPRAYLDALVWDETPRLATWLTTYVGADDSHLTSAIGVWALVAAVARLYQPGCQADHMLILEGPQGAGKSAIVRALGGPWYCPQLPVLTSERPGQDLQGAWIVEVAELDAFHGVAVSRIKDFVSRTVDVYRPSYGRHRVQRPRQCIFVGTTNDDTYLRDVSGARRFWPVHVGHVDPARLVRERDQLWAEARDAYRAEVPWWPDRGQYPALRDRQDERFESDPWEAPIAGYVESLGHVSTCELLQNAIGKPQEHWTRADQNRCADVLKRLGWAWKRTGATRQRRWYPPALHGTP